MSLLPATSHANPGTPFWATAGSGGAVTSILAGTGISVDTPTGNVTITNTGIQYQSLGDASSGTESTINIGDTLTIGTIKETIHYRDIDHFYTAGITLNISSYTTSSTPYSGNLWVTLDYSDGVTTSLQGRQTILISDAINKYTSASVVIGFKHVTGGLLTLTLTNQSSTNIASFSYDITNFYCVDNGVNGGFSTLFV
jgi:hypothetical protein